MEPSRLGSADTKCVGPAGRGEVGIVARAESVTVTTSSLAEFYIFISNNKTNCSLAKNYETIKCGSYFRLTIEQYH